GGGGVGAGGAPRGGAGCRASPPCAGAAARRWARPPPRSPPPVWIGGWGDITLRRAATLADNWIPGPTADLTRLLRGKEQFLANRRAAGRTQPITEWPLTRDLIIAETHQTARALAQEHIMVAYPRGDTCGWGASFTCSS